MLFLLIAAVLATDGLSMCTKSRITYYEGYESNGACGYGAISSLNLPSGMFTAAPNEAFLDGSNKCGVCYEMTGPKGSITFMVTDRCPASSNQEHCSGDMIHFDLGKNAFPSLVDLSVGTTNTTFRMIPCGLSGNVQVQLKDGCSQYWVGFYPRNHQIALKSVAISLDQQQNWIPLTREKDNFYQCQTTNFVQNAQPPFYIRLTSILDETVTVTLDTITSGKTYTADKQFSVPEGAFFEVETLEKIEKPKNAPQCCQAADEWSDVFSEGPNGMWMVSAYSGSINARSTNNPASGTFSAEASLPQYAGAQFEARVDVPRATFDAFEFKVRASETADNALQLTIGGSTTKIDVSVVGGSYVTKRVELSSVINSDFKLIEFQSMKAGTTTYWFDDLKLVKKDNYPGNECSVAGDEPSYSSESSSKTPPPSTSSQHPSQSSQQPSQSSQHSSQQSSQPSSQQSSQQSSSETSNKPTTSSAQSSHPPKPTDSSSGIGAMSVLFVVVSAFLFI